MYEIPRYARNDRTVLLIKAAAAKTWDLHSTCAPPALFPSALCELVIPSAARNLFLLIIKIMESGRWSGSIASATQGA